MTCERTHELLALDLYGELDDGERTTLAQHLAACAACRAFRVELAHGLGALASTAPSGLSGISGAGVTAPLDDLPIGWDAALARAVRAESLSTEKPLRSRGTPPLLVAVLAFAAGVLFTASIGLLERRFEPTLVTPLAPTPQSVARASGPAWIESSSPPPTTTTTGPLALAASYLEHTRSR